jgi:PKD domain
MVTSLVLAGCVSRYELPAAGGANGEPLAQAGAGASVRVTSTVQLDGSASLDPDGTVTAYRWKVISRPMMSQADVADANAARTTLTPDAVGRYVVELEITDDRESTDTDTVAFMAMPPSLVVGAGSDQQVTWLRTVQLAGSLTVEPGFSATGEWTLVQKPAKSTTVLAASTTLAPSFYADAEGTYVLALVGRTSYGEVTDTVTVTVTAPRLTFDYVVVAAEYAKPINKMIIATDAPPRLRIVDPESGVESAIVLPAAPTSLSLDPGGTRAAIGHDHAVTIVNLPAAVVQVTHAVPVYVWRLVYGTGARVHLLEQGFGIYPIDTLDVATGSVTPGPSEFGYANACATPDGMGMYMVEGFGSPASIIHYDLSTTPVTRLRSQTPFPQYVTSPMVLTEDGSTLLFGQGTAYYASSDAAVDMMERGTLGSYMSGAAHSSAIDRIGWFQTEYDQQSNPNGTRVLVSSATTLVQLRQIELPETVVGGVSLPTIAKQPTGQISFRSDGTRLYVLGGAGSTTVLFGVSP